MEPARPLYFKYKREGIKMIRRVIQHTSDADFVTLPYANWRVCFVQEVINIIVGTILRNSKERAPTVFSKH